MDDALTSGRSKATTPITEKNPLAKDSMIKQPSLTLPLVRPPKREWHDQGTCFHTSAQPTLYRPKIASNQASKSKHFFGPPCKGSEEENHANLSRAELHQRRGLTLILPSTPKHQPSLS